MRWWTGLAAMAIGVAALSGCGNSGGSNSGNARLRLLNASVGYSSLDLQVNSVVQNSAVAYGSVGNYASVSTDAITTSVAIAGTTASLSTASRTLSDGVSYTQVAYGFPGALKTALIQENVTAPASTQTSLTVLNLAPDAGNLDIYLSGATDPIGSAALVASNVSAGSGTSYNTVGAGTYRLRVTGTGDSADLRLDMQGVTLTGGQVQTLILTGTPGTQGGVLVNAIGMVQQGSVTPYANTLARARVVAGVSGNANVSVTIGSTVFPALVSPNPYSVYTVLGAGSLPVTVLVNGVAVPVANQTLDSGGDYTVLVWGSAANAQVRFISDDNRLPTNTANAKIRLVNAMSGAAVAPLTLVSDVAGTLASSVDVGSASSFVSNLTASSSVRLQVISPLQVLPLVDAQNQNIIAKSVYTMYVFGDPTAAPSTLTYALQKQR